MTVTAGLFNPIWGQIVIYFLALFVVSSTYFKIVFQDQNNEEIQLVVLAQGLVVFQNTLKLNTFFW